MERFLMNNIFKALDEILKDVLNPPDILQIDPPKSLKAGTLVKHIFTPNIFGVITESYETSKKDIDKKPIFYYNIIWESTGKASRNNEIALLDPLSAQRGYRTVEPEFDIIAYHGGFLN